MTRVLVEDVGWQPGEDEPSRSRPGVRLPAGGPHDVEDLDPAMTPAAGAVDFGAVQVPVPADATVAVEPKDGPRMQAVHVSVPQGRLSVSALAAPKSGRLWPDLAKEIDVALREGGARVRSFTGEWGRELHATTGAATSLFVGVDGRRWMLYGVATGPTSDAPALQERLRAMLRGTVVVRGRSPYPVRTVLPLVLPEHLAGQQPVPPPEPPAATRAAGAPAEGRCAPAAEPDPPTEPLRLPVSARPLVGAPAAPPVRPTGWQASSGLPEPDSTPRGRHAVSGEPPGRHAAGTGRWSAADLLSGHVPGLRPGRHAAPDPAGRGRHHRPD